MPRSRAKPKAIASDYSTPTTTRARRTARGGKPQSDFKRTPLLVYKPLELDNESSSESTDFMLECRGAKRLKTTPIVADKPRPATPLAIEGPPAAIPLPIEGPPAATPIPIDGPTAITPSSTEKHQPAITPLSTEKQQPAITPSSMNKQQKLAVSPSSVKRHQLAVTPSSLKKQRLAVSQSTIKAPPSATPIGLGPQVNQLCITPPITPEKAQEAEGEVTNLSMSKLPTFVPGNCNIEEILRVYGAAAAAKGSNTILKSQKESKV